MRLFLYLLLLPACSSCYMVRAYKNRKLTLRSHEHLPSRPVQKGDSVFHFAEGAGSPAYAPIQQKLDKELAGTSTAAFLVVRNDSIIYEKYFDGFNQQSLLPSFSVVKSFVATLVGICREEGKIKSLDQPFTDYLPRFLQKDPRFSQITIQHLLDMRSGLNWNEGEYGLKDDAIKMAFRPNITPHVYKVKIREAPGKFEYQSINTLLLAMVVEKATGKPISQYLQEKIWQPLQMESNATWSSDKRKREIAYAGLNATARDFAKFGRLYLREGDWQGKQIISRAWVMETTGNGRGVEGYKNQFWGTSSYTTFPDSLAAAEAGRYAVGSSGKVYSYISKEKLKQYYIVNTTPAYYALGILGQYIYINPATHTTIVRLGYFWKHPTYSADGLIRAVSEAL